MELIGQLIDFVLHIDKHLGEVIADYGYWTYFILFAIVFMETGLVVMPFLPGDSLLFAAGAFAATGALDVWVLFVLLAAAAIVGRGPHTMEIVAATAGTDGSKSDILAVEIGGTRTPFTVEGGRQELVMKGREVFKEAVEHMSAAAHEVLAQAGVRLEDIALLVPHQANMRILDAVRGELGLPAEKVVINVQEYGNTGSASVPLALWEARQQGRIKPGDLVLLVSFGAGFHWAGMLLRC